MVKNIDIKWRQKLQDKFQHQIKRWLKAYRNCSRHFGEPSVHDVRVQSRRLLSLLSIIALAGQKTKQVSKQIKTTLRHFSQLRDIHVQTLLLQQFTDSPPLQLQADLQRKEKRLLTVLKTDLKNADLASIKRSLRKINRSLKKRVNSSKNKSALSKIIRHVNEAFNNMIAHAQIGKQHDIAHIHEVRILFKKYRYSVEAISDIIPKISSMTVESMQKFQALMGDIHDLDILTGILNKHIDTHPKDKPRVQIIMKKAASKQKQRIREYIAFLAKKY